MIYVIEIPHQLPPVAWTAEDESELIAKVNADDRAGVVYERTTVRDLIDQYGEDDEEIAEIARRYSPDTTLYRADYLLGEGEYTTEAISEYDAAVAAIEHDRYAVMIFASEAEAREALASDENWAIHQGLQAREALRGLLGELPGETRFTWRTDAASGELLACNVDEALATLVRDGEWAEIGSDREARDIADGAWLTIFEDGVPVLRRGLMP